MGKQNKEKSNCLSFSRFQNVLQIVVQLSCHVTRQLFDFPHYLRQDERRRGRREEGREGDIAASQPAGWPRARTMVIWNTYLLMEHYFLIHYPWVVCRCISSGQVCQFRSEKGNSKKLGSGNSHIDLRSVCYGIP